MKLLVLICVFFGFAAAVQAASTALQIGEDCYLRGDYTGAERCLRHAVQVDPMSPDGHYWLANSLLKLSKGAQAQAEYMACLSLSPPAQMAQYCRQALDVLEYGQSDDGQVKNESAPVIKQGGLNQARHEQTLARINERVSRESQRLQAEGTQAAQKCERDGMQMQDRLGREEESTINQMKRATVSDLYGKQIPVYSDADYARVREEYANRGRLALDRAERNAQEAVKERKSRQAGLHDAASGLASQLGSSPSSPNGSMLVPEGTNLYVRNYQAGSADEDEDRNKGLVTPLMANPQRSPLAKNAPPAVAQADRGANSKETANARVETSVKGHLMGGQSGSE